MNFPFKKRNLFKSALRESAQKGLKWEKPNENSIIKYKNKVLPKSAYIYDVISEKDFKYLGNNEYIFNNENVSLDENYKVVQLLSHNCIESLGDIAHETKYEKDYINFCNAYNSRSSTAEYFYANDDKNKAIRILDDLFFETIDYCESFKKEHENEYIEEDDFELNLDE